MGMRFEGIDAKLSIAEEGEIKFYTYSPAEFSTGGKALLKSMPVFYNPIQEINRSLTLLAYRAFQNSKQQKNSEESFHILDSMAASGIRTLRLAKFLDKPFSITANDLNPLAIHLIRKNMELNHLSESIYLTNDDCLHLMTNSKVKREFFDIIDIDPFGTPNIFISPALHAIKKEGLLAITATDTPVLFGVRKNACIRKYNVFPLRSTFSKEVGLRVLLYYIAKHAHPLMRAIKPMLSVSFDHYIRVFVQIIKGEEAIRTNIQNTGYILWCAKCDWRGTTDLNILNVPHQCPNCGSKLDFGGPLWIGEIHEDKFVQELNEINLEVPKEVIPSKARIERTLQRISEEISFPLGYYDVHKICDKLQISVSSMKEIEDAIKSQGFNFARTHVEAHAIKSNIDIESLKAILIKLAQKST
ncbi:MAG: tRNA (guanine(10)-N(2))-dimethyltransferase [Promethearchaeota archaeon]